AGSSTGAQQQAGGGGTDQYGVNKYGQHLYQSLFYRMRYSGAGRRIRGGSHTGLIGKKTSFDTIHDTGTCKSSEDGTDVKGIRENVGEHFRNQGIVGHCHKKSYSQIEEDRKSVV